MERRERGNGKRAIERREEMEREGKNESEKGKERKRAMVKERRRRGERESIFESVRLCVLPGELVEWSAGLITGCR